MFLDGESDAQHRARLRRLSAAVVLAYDSDPDVESLKPAAAEAAMELLENAYAGLAELIQATKESAEALALVQVLDEAGAPRYRVSAAEQAYGVAAEKRSNLWDRVRTE